MRQSRTVVVERPPEEVYAYLADPRNLPQWVGPVADVVLDRETGEDPRPGDAPVRFRQSVEHEGEAASFAGELVADRGQARLEYRFDGAEGTLATTFRLEASSAGTRVRQVLEVPLSNVWTKVLAPFLYLANRSRMGRQLEDLKRALEASSA